MKRERLTYTLLSVVAGSILLTEGDARAQGFCSSTSSNCVEAASPSGVAVQGTSDGTTNRTAGVVGQLGSNSAQANGASGVEGLCFASGACNGVTGITNASGNAFNGVGVFGCEGSDSFAPCNATSLPFAGVYGAAASGPGVYGTSSLGAPTAGVYGTSSASQNQLGVYGKVSGTNSTGVEGTTDVGLGVFGQSTDPTNGWGVVGVNQSPGFNGTSGGAALEGAGEGVNGIGVYGRCLSNCANTGGGLAARFDGDIQLFASGSHAGNASKPTGTMWINTSDRRVKKDVAPFTKGIAELRQVHPVTFKFNGLGDTADNGVVNVGVIAQELEHVLPTMVGTRKVRLHKEDTQLTDIKTVDPNDFLYMLINAAQEQQSVIEKQQARLEKQEARLAVLERGRQPLLSSLAPGGMAGLAFALVPIGFVVARRRKDERDTSAR